MPLSSNNSEDDWLDDALLRAVKIIERQMLFIDELRHELTIMRVERDIYREQVNRVLEGRPIPQPDEELMTPEVIGRALNVSRTTVYHWIEIGWLVATKINARQLGVTKPELARFVEQWKRPKATGRRAKKVDEHD